MKYITPIVIILLCNIFVFSQKQTKNKPKHNRHLFYDGTLVNIYIDKTLYMSKEESFLIKITIENKTKADLAVDLSNYWKVIYPNQFGKLSTPERTEINERNILPDTLNQKKKDLLIKQFSSNELKRIPSGGKIEYYRNFNGGKKEQVLINKGEYLYISVDGQLFITDGKDKFEHIFVLNNKLVHADLILEYPINWGNISNKDAIIKKL